VDDTVEYVQDKWNDFKDWAGEKGQQFRDWADRSEQKITNWGRTHLQPWVDRGKTAAYYAKEAAKVGAVRYGAQKIAGPQVGNVAALMQGVSGPAAAAAATGVGAFAGPGAAFAAGSAVAAAPYARAGLETLPAGAELLAGAAHNAISTTSGLWNSFGEMGAYSLLHGDGSLPTATYQPGNDDVWSEDDNDVFYDAVESHGDPAAGGGWSGLLGPDLGNTSNWGNGLLV